MPFSKNRSEIVTDTNEIVATYTDVVGFFTGLSMSVSNPNQSFTIITRKTNTLGNDQDSVIGEIKAGETLVVQFKKVTGPTTLS